MRGARSVEEVPEGPGHPVPEGHAVGEVGVEVARGTSVEEVPEGPGHPVPEGHAVGEVGVEVVHEVKHVAGRVRAPAIMHSSFSLRGKICDYIFPID